MSVVYDMLDIDRIRITSGARKHRLTRKRIREALATAVFYGAVGDREFYVGIDNRGIEIELILVPSDRADDDRKACIHAMPTHYRSKESS